jgi:hypothetical protein
MIAAKQKQTNRRSQSVATNTDLFALEIRVRGRTDFEHEEVCDGLEDAIQIGERWFRAFQRRNPWFVQDSLRRKILILIDPETHSLFRQR